MSTLGKVADPAALDSCARARAHLRVDVLAAWLTEGAELELTVPARLACARCDGGGCDGCARSGALRAPEEAAARVLRARVPPRADGANVTLALRLPDPFGEHHAIGQLLVELRAAPSASAMVRIVPAPAPAAPPKLAISPLAVTALIAFAAALAALLAR